MKLSGKDEKKELCYVYGDVKDIFEKFIHNELYGVYKCDKRCDDIIDKFITDKNRRINNFGTIQFESLISSYEDGQNKYISFLHDMQFVHYFYDIKEEKERIMMAISLDRAISFISSILGCIRCDNISYNCNYSEQFIVFIRTTMTTYIININHEWLKTLRDASHQTKRR